MTTEINKPLLMPEPKVEPPRPIPPTPPVLPLKGLQAVDKELIKEMQTLSKEVRKLKNLEFVKILNHPLKFMWFSFLKGVMVGFGSVLGASVLVAVFVYILAQISFVPILGDFVDDMFKELNIEGKLTEQAMNNEDILNRFSETKDQINN